MKKVSIIVPIYNIQDYIDRCYESICNQTYCNWELIFVNDGSTDKSAEICESIRRKDKRVKVISTLNYGVSHARNVGIDNISGFYTMFIDGDDYIDSDMIEKLINNIEKNKCDISFSKYYYKDNEVKNISLFDFEKVSSKELLRYHLKFQFSASLWGGLYKSELLKNIRLVETMMSFEDWEFLFQIIQKSKNVSLCDGCFYHYVTRNGSATQSVFSEKIMSAFFVPDEVNHKIINKKAYKSEIDCLEINILLKIIVIFSTREVNDRKYCIQLKKIARRNLFLSIKSSIIDFKQKIYMVLISINPKLFKVIYCLKNGVHL